MTRRLFALLALVAAWFGVAVLAAAPASAHVELLSSNPADGARLTSAPAQVSLTLSENIGIQPNSIKVVDTNGTNVVTGPVFQPGDIAEQVAVKLEPDLPEGSYLVEYAFVSTDSHPVRGTIAFVVGTGPLITSAGAVSASTGTDPVTDALFTTFRWGSFGGVALLGGLVFVLVCRPAGRTDPAARKLITVGVGLSAVTAVAGFLLQGPYVAGRGVDAVFDPALIEATLRVAYGKLLLLRLAAIVALAVIARRLLTVDLPERSRSRYENLGIAAGFLVLLSFSATGHAVADKIMFLSVSADLAHFGAMAVWVGGLIQLAVLLRGRYPAEEAEPSLARFHSIATVSIVIMVVSGAYLGFRLVPSVEALWTSSYGIVFLLKLTGFAALLLVANVSRTAVRRGIAGRGDSGVVTADLRRLRVSVGVEVLIVAVVLALAAALSSMSPTG
ncbi:copper resistance CopC/CopD family protein [Amycolatopsis regifaucium]|uniref:Copper resistance protein n=1 Tax=Amycolatopsis regifaucium TaxID=546365 RepID=A0A154MI77_9PSEU|nr:copper resistance protein CopC [Amycolatopsis regifaucium]KZB84164.1 copper resistance protein [Amycolatopsis regifaucium]OKA08656.1 copper resistance protein [Amycolatopsis regifaucium]SFJ58453.1 copper transport protein [Amycolatopsis regifaucium]